MTAAPGSGGSEALPTTPESSDPLVGALLQRCRFPAGRALDVAVSGGADSVALLALAVASGADVTAHHVDHGTRPGGTAEAERVRGLCAHWGTAFRAHAVEVDAGPNLEARWREARRGVLPPGCLTGHTADDQAETLVLRLLRGTGPHGLAAMSPDTHPILDLRRSETESLCEHLGVGVFRDPTNDSPEFARNRVRREVLPLLSDISGRDVVPLLVRTAQLAARQRELLAELADGVDPTDCAALRELPRELAVEVIRGWWISRTGGLPPPDRDGLERMMAVVNGTTRSCQVTAGWTLARTAGSLRLEPPQQG